MAGSDALGETSSQHPIVACGADFSSHARHSADAAAAFAKAIGAHLPLVRCVASATGTGEGAQRLEDEAERLRARQPVEAELVTPAVMHDGFVYAPFMQRGFGTAALQPEALELAAVVAAIVLPAISLEKALWARGKLTAKAAAAPPSIPSKATGS